MFTLDLNRSTTQVKLYISTTEINAVGRIQTGQQVEDASEASTLVTRPNSSTPGKGRV